MQQRPIVSTAGTSLAQAIVAVASSHSASTQVVESPRRSRSNYKILHLQDDGTSSVVCVGHRHDDNKRTAAAKHIIGSLWLVTSIAAPPGTATSPVLRHIFHDCAQCIQQLPLYTRLQQHQVDVDLEKERTLVNSWATIL